MKHQLSPLLGALMIAGAFGCASGPVAAATRIDGQVQAGGAAVAGSTVTLWAAGAGGGQRIRHHRIGGAGCLNRATTS